MTQPAADTTGLVRVRIVVGERRADLAVPGTIPVAQLLPEFAYAVGALDPYTVHEGFRLVGPDGRPLAPAGGLTLQGVHDGCVLGLEPSTETTTPPVYDDPVEAVAVIVEAQSHPWDPAAARRTALASAALLLGAGAGALGLMRSTGGPVVAVGAVLATLLVCGAAVLARVQREPEAAVVTALLALPYAAVAGVALAAVRT